MEEKEKCKMKHRLFLQSIDDLYHRMGTELGEAHLWSMNADELCEEIEDYVKRQFKRWCKQEVDKDVSSKRRN